MTVKFLINYSISSQNNIEKCRITSFFNESIYQYHYDSFYFLKSNSDILQYYILLNSLIVKNTVVNN